MRLRSPEAIEVLRRHKQWIDSNGAQANNWISPGQIYVERSSTLQIWMVQTLRG